MNRSLCVAPRRFAAGQGTLRPMIAAGLLVSLTLASAPARALDGCLVLLCLAAPDWTAIPQCVPPIEELFSELALGHAFPTCTMSGPGNSAANHWSNPPDYCPPQYTHSFDLDSGTIYHCDYAAAIEVNIDGALWTRVWWQMNGGSVTEYTDAAKVSLGSWNPKFDDDYAAWAAQQSPQP